MADLLYDGVRKTDGYKQRIYRDGDRGFSFIQAPGQLDWEAAPLRFFGQGPQATFAIDHWTTFGRVRTVGEDEIEPLVSSLASLTTTAKKEPTKKDEQA